MKLFQSEFIDQETIDALIAGVTKYNNAKTAEEGFEDGTFHDIHDGKSI